MGVVDLSTTNDGRPRKTGVNAAEARLRVVDAEEALFSELEALAECMPFGPSERVLLAGQQAELHRLIQRQRAERVAVFHALAAKRH